MKFPRWGKALALTLTLILLTPSVLPAAAAVRAGDDPTAVMTLADGTEFEVETTEEISSKTAAEGDPLTFKVVEDLKVNGQTVIAAGTLVKGVVSNAKKAGMMGKGGQLGIRSEERRVGKESRGGGWRDG